MAGTPPAVLAPVKGRTVEPGAGLTERLVTLPDGRRIRAVVAGEGPGPLVVFEAGMSAPAASWIHTQRQISAHHRTLSYDRAGYGGSDIDPEQRTLDRIVDDLTATLDALGETGPLVLVGHSWGGPIIRLFADRYPARVAGMVFVDATVAEVMAARNVKIGTVFFRLMALLARAGARNLITRVTFPRGLSAEISAADVEIMMRDYASARAMRAAGRESEQIVAGLPIMRRLQETGTPNIPVVCLQGARIDRGMKKGRPWFNRITADLMAAAPQGELVLVEDAGHLIPQESPGIVRDTVLGVVRRGCPNGHSQLWE